MKAKLKDLMFSSRGTQIITIETREDFRQTFEDLQDCDVSFTVKKYFPRRSLDANAYFWVLLDKLAVKMNMRKDDLYRNYVRQMGGNNFVTIIADAAVKDFRKMWSEHGTGWFIDVLPNRTKGFSNVTCYYGSSQYDTKQMSKLINLVIEDCRAVGVETRSPEYVASLLQMWGGDDDDGQHNADGA